LVSCSTRLWHFAQRLVGETNTSVSWRYEGRRGAEVDLQAGRCEGEVERKVSKGVKEVETATAYQSTLREGSEVSTRRRSSGFSCNRPETHWNRYFPNDTTVLSSVSSNPNLQAVAENRAANVMS
jgi:hypothetical protein